MALAATKGYQSRICDHTQDWQWLATPLNTEEEELTNGTKS